jgi:hypothetical protein
MGDHERRFESKVNRTGGPDACHYWQGVPDSVGYGAFSVGQQDKRAHVFAWELENGPVPAGYDVDHECHNRAVRAGTCRPGACAHRLCVNPRHLAAKSHRQHMNDTEPWYHPSGSANGKAKLTEHQAEEIKTLLTQGVLQRDIAEMFSVSRSAIGSISAGRTWR